MYPASAVVENGALVVASSAPDGATIYPVGFTMPEGGSGLPVTIDSTTMTVVDLAGDETEIEATSGAQYSLCGMAHGLF